MILQCADPLSRAFAIVHCQLQGRRAGRERFPYVQLRIESLAYFAFFWFSCTSFFRHYLLASFLFSFLISVFFSILQADILSFLLSFLLPFLPSILSLYSFRSDVFIAFFLHFLVLIFLYIGISLKQLSSLFVRDSFLFLLKFPFHLSVFSSIYLSLSVQFTVTLFARQSFMYRSPVGISLSLPSLCLSSIATDIPAIRIYFSSLPPIH